jgi:hypothetical protein
MKVKPELVIDYAGTFHDLDVAPERANKIAGELDRLVTGLAAAPGKIQPSDDPWEFVATLLELRETAERGDD